MRRLHLFEIADQNWCPLVLRRAVTAFLATVGSRTRIYLSTSEVVKRALDRASNKSVIVLCAGSGGGILDVADTLPPESKIVLTDLLPDIHFTGNSPGLVYDSRSIDARKIPADLKGARVIYGSFHHFNPDDARAILEAAACANESIAIFEGTERSFRGIAVSFLIPLLVLLIMPLTKPKPKPFRALWMALTYLVPILPLVIFWDGLVSSLRSYTQQEMRAFVESLTSHEWEIGILSGPHRERITYLFGAPRRSARIRRDN